MGLGYGPGRLTAQMWDAIRRITKQVLDQEIPAAVFAETENLVQDVDTLQATVQGKANTNHLHELADVNGLQTALDGKAPSLHVHSISSVTGLQAALDDKAASAHTHSLSALLTTGVPSATTFLRGDGMWAEVAGGGGVTVHNDLTGRDAIGAHPIGAITGLQAELDGKAVSTHTHLIANVTGLQTALDDKAALAHTHPVSALSNATLTAQNFLTASTTSAMRFQIGAAADNHTHPVSQLSDATEQAKTFLTAASTSDMRAAISAARDIHGHEGTQIYSTGVTAGHVLTADGLGTSGWAAPSGGGSVAAADITDSTTVGQALITAVDEAAARDAILASPQGHLHEAYGIKSTWGDDTSYLKADGYGAAEWAEPYGKYQTLLTDAATSVVMSSSWGNAARHMVSNSPVSIWVPGYALEAGRTYVIYQGGDGAITFAPDDLNTVLYAADGVLTTAGRGSRAELLVLSATEVYVTISRAPIPVDSLDTSGAASSTTYLRGDGAWATPDGGGGSGGSLHWPRQPGRYHSVASVDSLSEATPLPLPADRLYLLPFHLSAGSWDGMAITTKAGDTTGGQIQYGVYAEDFTLLASTTPGAFTVGTLYQAFSSGPLVVPSDRVSMLALLKIGGTGDGTVRYWASTGTMFSSAYQMFGATSPGWMAGIQPHRYMDLPGTTGLPSTLDIWSTTAGHGRASDAVGLAIKRSAA